MPHRFRRKYIRLKVSRPVEFVTAGRVYHGVITDEGSAGVFIEAKGKFSAGDRIKMTYVTHQSVQVSRQGTIVRVEPSGFAVAFDNPQYAR
ncbi:MAG: PilZ domain-containing protein [Deltaproteobacteria bacterium]|nr:PilZ domain-containing protein [Deltaproteobacteria bacterium]MBW1955929.1 PilZ domain-containing protein [Deltaproteobacteria bacterium]MBW2041298.1 PilZ domain-containing protein [Deltaproteobacteria bacterium]MBW2131772.1 PilZ domain-containing protein [Deltaproteobacteria bacterium]